MQYWNLGKGPETMRDGRMLGKEDSESPKVQSPANCKMNNTEVPEEGLSRRETNARRLVLPGEKHK